MPLLYPLYMTLQCSLYALLFSWVIKFVCIDILNVKIECTYMWLAHFFKLSQTHKFVRYKLGMHNNYVYNYSVTIATYVVYIL